MGRTYVMSEEHKRKIGNANRGARHGLWKGNLISYKGLHTWISRNYGTPMKCEECGNESLARYHWANISGTYTRERSDWKRLCPKCHYKQDWGQKGNPNAKLSKENILIIQETARKYGIMKKLAVQFGVDRHTISRYFSRYENKHPN